MAIRDVVTRGYGNGTYSGSIAKSVVRGFFVAVNFIASWAIEDDDHT